VRLADILGLALSALWQQKARTLLTTLGVVFGSFVLAASLSVGQGVQEILDRESHRNNRLRRIEVHPQWVEPAAEAPASSVQIQGEMGDAKKERLRKVLAQRKRGTRSNAPWRPLTRERLQELAGIEHVESVEPFVLAPGWATFNDHSEAANVMSRGLDNDALRRRIVAGQFFDTPDARAVVVSEFLLYRCGITDDASVQEVPGKKIRLEFRARTPQAGLGLFLSKPGGNDMTAREAAALEKIKQQLPATLDKFQLTRDEREALRMATSASPPKAEDAVVEEFPIVGVLRLANDDEIQNRPWEETSGEILLPSGTAEELFFRSPGQAERGLDRAVVIVDQDKNVKEALQKVRATGLDGFAAIEFIERERLMFVLIFGGMTCIAAVALLVAALGIANTMLMSVLERTREVGVMKAVGAGNGHVQMIFLVEGALIGLSGGCLGLLLGRIAAIPGDSWVRSMVARDLKFDLKESLFVFPPWLMITVVAFAAVVTTLAAVYPARRAARVNPVTALRHE
jgi:putative ABC transport system permease protein